MFIRLLNPEDQAQLERLSRIAAMRANRQREEEEEERSWSQQWGLRDGDLGVGYDQHGLKGACWIRKQSPESDQWNLIMALDRSHRGQGIGGQLLDKLLEEADRSGVQKISLVVRPENRAARKLYARAGFTEAGTDDQARIIMERETS